MTKDSVLFLMYPAIGHLHATFALAKELQNLEKIAIFAGPVYYKNYIETQGFEYRVLNSFPFASPLRSKTYKLKYNKNVGYLDEMLARLGNEVFESRKNDISNLIELEKPNFVFIDTFLSSDFIILYTIVKSKNIKIAFIQTMLSTYQQSSSAPPNSLLCSKNKLITKSAWAIFLLIKTCKEIRNRIAYFGYDDVSLFKTKCFEVQIPAKHKILVNKAFHPGFDNIPEIITAPEELEVDVKSKKSFQYYIGSSVDTNRKEHFPLEYRQFINNIMAPERGSHNKIIYCSLGTLYDRHNKKFENFIRMIIDIIEQNQNYYLILSMDKNLITIKKNVSERIFIHNQIPQLHVLQHCNLFITHGGLNSIKEGIHFGVPLLVFPIDAEWDQFGNAAKIKHHGIGLLGNIRSDPQNAIKDKIEEVITNPVYKSNIMNLNAKVNDKKYSSANSVLNIEYL